MRIGIDIDDTSFSTVDVMIKYADFYDMNVLGRNGTNGKLGLIKDRYYLQVLYGWDKDTKFDFFNKYYKNVLQECKAIDGVANVVKKLKEQGDEIYFVTARLTNIPNCDTYNITKQSLENGQIAYDELIVNACDKITISKEKQIDLFIEDSYEICEELEKIGIKTILMTTPMNKMIDAGNIERVNNWQEIYTKIENYRRKM